MCSSDLVVDKNKVDFIVITPVFAYTVEYLEAILRQKPDKFIEVYRQDSNVIYRARGSPQK